VCNRELLESHSQAHWECVIECNQEYTWELAKKCIWYSAFMFVVYSVMYSILYTKSHMYHSDQVNLLVDRIFIVPLLK
jgi:hypothetical protein